MNIFAKFQLYSPYSFWGDDFLIFLKHLAFWLPLQQIKLKGLDKKYMSDRKKTTNISKKTFVKISVMK